MIYLQSSFLLSQNTGIGRYGLELSKAMSDKGIDYRHALDPNSLLHFADKSKRLRSNNLANMSLKYGCFDLPITVKYTDNRLQREILRSLRNIVEKALPRDHKRLQLPKEVEMYHSLFAPFLFKEDFPTKSALTVHDTIPFLFPDWCTAGNKKRFVKILEDVKRVDRVLCVSESTANNLLQIVPEIDPKKIFICPLAAAPSFRPRESFSGEEVKRKYGIPTNKKILLSVCTLEPRKNLNRVISVWKSIQNKYKDWALVLVGGSGWGGVFEQISNEQDLKRTYLTGFVDDCDLEEIYASADLFIYPSLYEGFGLPILEAMQSGLPVIAANTSSIPEVVGADYPLVDLKEEGDLKRRLVECLQSESLRSSLSREGINRAKEFSWENTTQLTQEAYGV